MKFSESKKPILAGFLAASLLFLYSVRNQFEPRPAISVPEESKQQWTSVTPQNPQAKMAPLAPAAPIAALAPPTGMAMPQPVPTQTTPKQDGSRQTLAPRTATPTAAHGCYQVTFLHQRISSHLDGETCLHHSNLLTLESRFVNPTAVCVEVNGEVVRHRLVSGHPQQFLIGPEAGPNATITARFCIGPTPTSCQKKCAPSADHFLTALGATQEEGAGWSDNSKDSAEEVELKKEMKDFSQLAKLGTSPSDTAHNKPFTGWIAQEYRFNSACTAKGGEHAPIQVSKNTDR